MNSYDGYESPRNIWEFELPQRSSNSNTEPRMSLTVLKRITRSVTDIVYLSLVGVPPRLHKQVFPTSSRETLINATKQKYISTWSFLQFQIWFMWMKFNLRRLIVRAKREFNNSFVVQIRKRNETTLKIQVVELPVTWSNLRENPRKLRVLQR